MVVLAIVAILGFAVYPWLSTCAQVLMVKGAAENVAGAIRMARQLAITQGARTTASSSGRASIVFGTGGHDPVVQRGRRLRLRLAAVVCERDGRVDRADPCLRPNRGIEILPGGVAATNFTVDTSPASCRNTIIVTLYGGVRVAGLLRREAR